MAWCATLCQWLDVCPHGDSKPGQDDDLRGALPGTWVFAELTGQVHWFRGGTGSSSKKDDVMCGETVGPRSIRG